jgi:hypothetical protein
MKGFLRRLTGQKAETQRVVPAAAPPPMNIAPDMAVNPPPIAATQQATATPVPPAPGMADAPGPVFSSRAVRDATVVTGAIDALGRFVAGQDVTGDLIHRLESLTGDQVNFLQLSAEPGLIQRALARTDGQKGTKAAALRKLLGDIAGGAIADAGKSDPLLLPTEPILPPLASLKHKPVVAGIPTEPMGAAPLPSAPSPAPNPAPVAPPPSAPRLSPLAPPVIPTAQASTASVAAAIAAAPLPPRPRAQPITPPQRNQDVPPIAENTAAPAIEPVALAPIITSSTVETPPPVPAPPPTMAAADFAALPRLARADAEGRRARLMAALNDHLSENEAAL